MKRGQFIQLLQSPTTINHNLIDELEDITIRFPYFQNAHLLLAKQYHGHQNIRYENYLRKASAYCPNRSVLYRLIKSEPAEIIHMESPALESPGELQQVNESHQEENSNFENFAILNKTPEQPQEKEIFIGEEFAKESGSDIDEREIATPDQEVISQENDRFETGSITTEPQDETLKQETGMETDATNIFNNVEADEIHSTDPMEIIEKRLREIESEKTDPAEKTDEENVGSDTKWVSHPNDEPDHENTSHEYSDMPLVEINEPITGEVESKEGSNLEHIIPDNEESVSTKNIHADTEMNSADNTFESSTKERTTPFNTVAAKSETKNKLSDAHSFIDWLKIKSVPVVPADQISDYLNLEDGNEIINFNKPVRKPEDALLDKFIDTQPRIVAQKSEFYSPGNMARKSAMEHEDLISETLARIYAQQGNIPKAIDAYRRLSLKIPEKSSYFAALIKDLEETEG